MFPSKATHITSRRRLESLDTVRNHLAEAMIGKAVDLMAGSRTVRHGVVSGVFSEAGRPKIVVAGHRYDVSQVLTILPVSLNQKS